MCKAIPLFVWVCAIGLWTPLIGAEEQASSLPTLEAPNFADANAVLVTRIVDGDTIVVRDDQGDSVKVRLIGVDTPETVHPNKSVQRYGKEASRFTKNLLKGEKVYLIPDAQQGATDRYGRTLAHVYRFPDGLFVNAEIIRQGYGHAYTKYPFKYMIEFKQLEKFAREAEKGLWSPVEKAQEIYAKPAGKDITVYITRTGRKYHRGSCSYLRRSRIPMKLSKAKGRYGPCSRCKPPK